MRYYVKYGTRPGEKQIGKGNFICPTCCRKRIYKRYKVRKELFLGSISIPSKDLGEYIHCQSCLQPFPSSVLEPNVQLKLNIDNSPLPPANIMEGWRTLYNLTNCEGIIARTEGIVEVISPILFTIASNFQSVGVKLQLEEHNEAKQLLISILNFGLEWQDFNVQHNLGPQKNTPKQHELIMEFMSYSHILLSRLP